MSHVQPITANYGPGVCKYLEKEGDFVDFGKIPVLERVEPNKYQAALVKEDFI